MSLRILGVHGVRNHRPRLSEGEAIAELSHEWLAALPGAVASDNGVDLRVAYYAAHLNAVVRQSDTDLLDHLPRDAKEWLVQWASQLRALPPDIPQAAWSIPARQIADMMAKHAKLSRRVVRPLVAAFLSEIRAYFHQHDPAPRRGAQMAVAQAIREHQPHLILAHSLGSVVTYETLWSNLDLHVPTLVTLGSPLAMRSVVFDRLVPPPQEGRGRRPPNISRWINIADPGDIVAVPRPFTDRFAPDEDHDDSHIHWLDFHTAGRYLGSPYVVAAIESARRSLAVR